MSKSTQLARSFNTQVGEGSLTSYFLPTLDGNFRDMYRSGWLPSWFNQQWGGSQWGNMPDASFGSVATGYVEDNTGGLNAVGGSAGYYFASQGFIVSESVTNPTVWVKIYKSGNPTNALTVSVRANSGGSPTGADLASGTIAARTVTSKTDGEWYSVTLSGTFTANTQYHLVVTQSTTDASNYYFWKGSNTPKYPHGFVNAGTSAPVWTQYTAYEQCFLIQNPAANSLIQSGGQFDYKLSFAAGSPVNQSRAVAQPLVNFYDGKNCTVLHRGTYSANTNIWDFCYGLDHDRIVCGVDASGYPYVRLFESDGTAVTVAHNASITTGFHDVGIKVRTVGDGADYLYLYVDGVSVGTPLTAQTFTMAPEMRQLGTARLGECFTHLPTWTQDMQMTSLPSAQGWTWTGTATEANAMSIQGGKLYQNANGYTSAQTGYYQKATAFVNATGWTVSWKGRTTNSSNSALAASTVIAINDGSKVCQVNQSEYFVEVSGTQSVTSGADFYYQGDFKSIETVFTLLGKGSDFYLLANGKLIVDGTGKLTAATASNTLAFGDGDTTASQNSDAIWSYVKYYQGGMLLPTAGSNTCSEFAHWSGDKSALFPSLYNSGTPVSVKQLCGVPRNYQFEQVVQREVRRGVTSNPTTTSTSLVVANDLEAYVIGESIESAGQFTGTLSTGNSFYTATKFDGALVSGSNMFTSVYTASAAIELTSDQKTKSQLGLHKVEMQWAVGAGTGTLYGNQRSLNIEAKV